MNVNGTEGKPILDCIMHKLPWTRRYYQVRLVVPDSGSPFVEYRQVSNIIGARKIKKSAKIIRFTDLLFADKKHDTHEECAFSIYSIDKTITFLSQDEGTMNEWLTKIRELHSSLYPEFKRYDSIFEAKLLDKGLATTLQLHGHYRLAVCKESLDLIPLLTVQDQLQYQQQLHQINQNNNNSNNSKTATQVSSTTTTINVSGSDNAANPSTTVASNVTVPFTTTNSAGVGKLKNHNNHHHHPIQHHHDTTNTPNNFSNSSSSSYLTNQHEHHHHHPLAGKLNQTQDHHHHHHLPQHLPIHQRFLKRHPLLASKTIELVLRSIRRCGHTQANFYIESGRQSPIGQGDLWMGLSNKATARQLHELLLATMKLASATEDQYPFKAPRSRSGSSSDNTQRSQPSLITTATALVTHDNNIDEDNGYLAMA